MPTARAGWIGAALVLLGATLFGFLGVGSRFAYEAGLHPFAFVAWRAGFGALGLALVVLLVRRPRVSAHSLPASAASVRRALLLAVVLGAGVNLCMFLAFDRTTVALALLGFYTYPAMIAAASALLGRETLHGGHLAALALATTGMVAVVLGGLDSTAARFDVLGIALGLLAGAFQTAFVLTSRRYASVRADVAIGTVLAGSTIIASVTTVATTGLDALLMPLSSPAVIGLMIGIGLFAAALPSVLLLIGIRWIGGVRTGIIMLFEPVVGVGLAAALLAESLQPLQVAGGALILLAALIVQRTSRAPAEAAVLVPATGGP